MEDKKDIFKKAIERDSLKHSYLFHGWEIQRQFSFAKSLANYLETGFFEEPAKILRDTRITEMEGAIGIDSIQSIRNFLWLKPVNSSRRTAIIYNTENLTSEAQTALLKITEEPPASALIILIGRDEKSLPPALCSRLIQIYFPADPRSIHAKSGEPSSELDLLLEKWYPILRQNMIQNAGKIKWLLERETAAKRYNLNPILQARAISKFLNNI